MPEVPAVDVSADRRYRPEGEENSTTPWYVKTTVKGASSGKLAGKKIALRTM